MGKWESVLHFMVGGSQQEAISREAAGTLLHAGLRKKENGQSAPVITNGGFQFLLMDTSAQVWHFLLQYLDRKLATTSSGLDLVERLGFLFQLRVSSPGQDYSTDGMTENLLTFLKHLSEFGLVYLQRPPTGRFYLTTLVVDIASAASKSRPE